MCDRPEDLRDVWCSRRKLAGFRDSHTCMEVVISCRAESASCCFVLSSALCSAARLFSSSTSALASFSLDTPAFRKTAKQTNKQSRRSFLKVLLVICFVFFPLGNKLVVSASVCVMRLGYLQVLLPGGELALLAAVYLGVHVQEGHVLAGRRAVLPA